MNAGLVLQEKGNAGKIRLPQAPYTYARISAMKSKIIRRDDYNRLMKMKLSDITRFLQETEYKKEIDEMAVSHEGLERIELALYKNLTKTFQKLKRIAEYEGLKLVMEEYMKRFDVWNIKTIIRCRSTGEENIKDMLMPVGQLSERFLDELIKKDSVGDIISSLKFLSKDQVKESIDFYKEKNSLFAIENILDRIYYTGALEFSKRMPRQGRMFKEFIENEVDSLNIKMIMKLKKQGIEKKEIKEFLVLPGGFLKKHSLHRLAEADSVDSMLNMLGKMGYAKLLKGYDKSTKDTSQLELMLNKHLLDQQILLLHQHPLSVDVILGFMFAKDIEVRNLRTIMKGKQLGLRDEFIEKELVIGG